jgi:hypothetical protein
MNFYRRKAFLHQCIVAKIFRKKIEAFAFLRLNGKLTSSLTRFTLLIIGQTA